MRYFLMLLFFCMSFISCLDDVDSLGSNYYMINLKWSHIYYNNKYDGSFRAAGYPVIDEPDFLTHYNKNRRFIICRTENYINNDSFLIKYWLIDKSVPINIDDCFDRDTACFNKKLYAGRIGPMDSVSFYKKLDELNIDMKLQKVDR